MSRGSARFAAFDGLRAVAVLLVFLTHMAPDVFPGGWIGVDLFFVLSGYLITTLLLGEWDRRGSINLRRFYGRRALRLWPALIVVVAVTTPFAFAMDEGKPLLEAAMAGLYLTDLYGPITNANSRLLGHTWSLAVEEQFYLVWPALLILALRRGWPLRGLVVSLAGAAAVAGFVFAVVASPGRAYLSPFPHAPELLIGVLLSLGVRNRDGWLQTLRAPWLVPLLVAGLVAGALTLTIESLGLYTVGFVALAVWMAALVGALAVNPDGWQARAFSWAPAVWLGQRSYGFYLFHHGLVIAAHRFVPNLWLGAVAAFAASLLVTELSWRLVEQPFLRLKERLSPSPHVSVLVHQPSEPVTSL